MWTVLSIILGIILSIVLLLFIFSDELFFYYISSTIKKGKKNPLDAKTLRHLKMVKNSIKYQRIFTVLSSFEVYRILLLWLNENNLMEKFIHDACSYSYDNFLRHIELSNRTNFFENVYGSFYISGFHNWSEVSVAYENFFKRYMKKKDKKYKLQFDMSCDKAQRYLIELREKQVQENNARYHERLVGDYMAHEPFIIPNFYYPEY